MQGAESVEVDGLDDVTDLDLVLQTVFKIIHVQLSNFFLFLLSISMILSMVYFGKTWS